MVNEWLLIMANGLLMCLFVILANEWILIMASGLQILIFLIYIYTYNGVLWEIPGGSPHGS